MKRMSRKEIDWSPAEGLWAQLNNREISQRFGIRYSHTSLERRRLIKQALASGLPTTPFVFVPRSRDFDWSQVEGLWATTSNVDLSKKLGLSFSRVLNKRKDRIREAKRKGKNPEIYRFRGSPMESNTPSRSASAS